MSQAIEIADAVVNELNSGAYLLPAEAVRKFVAYRELSDTDDAAVYVSPSEQGPTVEKYTRSADQEDYTIEIGVMKRWEGPITDAELDCKIDEMMVFMEQLRDRLRGVRIAKFQSARQTTAEIPLHYSRDHYERLRQFTGVLSLTYRTYRTLGSPTTNEG